MKNSFVTILLTIAVSGQIMAQDSLDFLDKVNDKPKSTTTKPKEETTATTVKKTTDKVATTTTSKKKKSKKKNSKAAVIAAETNVNANTNPVHTNSFQTAVNTVLPESKTVTEPAVKVEEEVSVSGLWIDPKINVEPDGLPGFGGDATLIRSQNPEDKSSGNPATVAASGKPLFSFSDFFDKYKKAMLILGFIILFAFYRLRMARPSSSSNNRPYRR
ncbi:SRP-less Sec system protein [Leptospira sp. 'Mane']|uniref:SRP-less Sec system protein n=1 Tax=Leptospira sp. 'Mane' TaxID=3387407 RepID=UPI00398B3EBF